MELEGLAALLTRDGWSLLEALPPYDRVQALAVGERLRAEGHAPQSVECRLCACQFLPFAFVETTGDKWHAGRTGN